MARFNGKSTADEVVSAADVRGKRMLVTGATSGIGSETARALAAGGAHVWLGCRSEAKGDAARSRILANHPDAQVDLFVVDLGSLSSIRSAAQAFDAPSLDVLICNAGVYGGGYNTTEDGLERVVGVSHVGHFLLAHLLFPKLEAEGGGRVVMVSSESHRTPSKLDFDKLPLDARNYSDFVAYGQAKLCNALFANELNRRAAGRGVTASSLHPGTMISTDIGRSSRLAKVGMALLRPFTRSLAQGAATSCYVATAPELEGKGGLYFDKCQVREASRESRDPQVAARLWERSEGWAKLAEDERIPPA